MQSVVLKSVLDNFLIMAMHEYSMYMYILYVGKCSTDVYEW